MTGEGPRTEAGRRMLDEFPAYNEGRSFGTHWPLHSILAIEREAAAAPEKWWRRLWNRIAGSPGEDR